MSSNQSVNNTDKIQEEKAKLVELLLNAKKIKQEMDEVNKKSMENLDNLCASADKAINNLNNIYSSFDKAEKEASDELDNLILQQAEDSTTE